MNTTRAGTGQRFLGYVVDGSLISTVVSPIAYLMGYDLSDGRRTIKVAFLPLIRDIGGASPGKLLLRIRVVGTDGATAHPVRRIARNLPLALSLMVTVTMPRIPVGGLVGIVDVIFLFFGSKYQRPGDKIAGTTVGRLLPRPQAYLDLGENGT